MEPATAVEAPSSISGLHQPATWGRVKEELEVTLPLRTGPVRGSIGHMGRVGWEVGWGDGSRGGESSIHGTEDVKPAPRFSFLRTLLRNTPPPHTHTALFKTHFLPGMVVACL